MESLYYSRRQTMRGNVCIILPLNQHLNVPLCSGRVSRETRFRDLNHPLQRRLVGSHVVHRGYWESIFLFPPPYPTPEGGCYNRAWEGGSTCVSVIIWALQRSTVKADMLFSSSFVCHWSPVGFLRGSQRIRVHLSLHPMFMVTAPLRILNL